MLSSFDNMNNRITYCMIKETVGENRKNAKYVKED